MKQLGKIVLVTVALAGCGKQENHEHTPPEPQPPAHLREPPLQYVRAGEPHNSPDRLQPTRLIGGKAVLTGSAQPGNWIYSYSFLCDESGCNEVKFQRGRGPFLDHRRNRLLFVSLDTHLPWGEVDLVGLDGTRASALPQERGIDFGANDALMTEGDGTVYFTGSEETDLEEPPRPLRSVLYRLDDSGLREHTILDRGEWFQFDSLSVDGDTLTVKTSRRTLEVAVDGTAPDDVAREDGWSLSENGTVLEDASGRAFRIDSHPELSGFSMTGAAKVGAATYAVWMSPGASLNGQKAFVALIR